MPNITYSTTADKRSQKVDAWRDALTQAFGPMEVRRNSSESFGGTVRAFGKGQMQFNETAYHGQTVERTARNVAELGQQYFTLGRPVSGSLCFQQNDQQVMLEPGCLVLTDQTVPYKVTADTGYHGFSISIPCKLLQQREPNIGSFYKLDAGDESPRGQLLSGYAKYLTDGIAAWDETEIISLREQMLDLIVLMMINRKNAYLPAFEKSIISAHRERAIAYIKHHHCNPNLSPKSIAAGCGISVSYLYRIFQSANMQIEQTVYAHRLETCRHLLLDAAHQNESVQQVGYKSGFNHSTHFSRMFKEKFGMSPADFRATQGGTTS